MCLARAARMSPASPDLTGRKSLIEIKDQAPKVQGKEKSQGTDQIPPDQGQRHRHPLGITSQTLCQAALSIPPCGTTLAQKLFQQAQSQPVAGQPMACPW